MQPPSAQNSNAPTPDAAASGEAQRREQDSLRATLLAEIDAQRLQLRVALADLHAARAMANSGDAHRLEERLSELDGLRSQIALAGNVQHLTQLQHRLAEAGGQAASAVRQSYDRVQGAGGPLAAAEYQRRSTGLAQEAHAAMAQNDRLFREGEDVARRYGVDLSAYTQERDRLTKERNEAEKRGDHLHARMADALIARTTTNALTETLPHITDPAERARQLVRIERAKEQEEAARKRLENQAELDGRKQATERGLSPDEAKAHVESVKRGAIEELKTKQDQLPAPHSRAAAGASLSHDTAASPDRELAGSLSPQATANARQAAAAITGSQPAESSAGEAKAPLSATASRAGEARTV